MGVGKELIGFLHQRAEFDFDGGSLKQYDNFEDVSEFVQEHVLRLRTNGMVSFGIWGKEGQGWRSF